MSTLAKNKDIQQLNSKSKELIRNLEKKKILSAVKLEQKLMNLSMFQKILY